MESRIARTIAGAILALAIPIACNGFLQAGTAAASPNTTNSFSAAFNFVSGNFVGTSHCNNVTATTPGSSTATRHVTFSTASCTTTSSSGQGLPASSTTTFHDNAGITYTLSPSDHIHMTSATTFEDAFGSTGSCTVSFNTGLNLGVTATHQETATATTVSTVGATTVSGTAHSSTDPSNTYCATIRSLLGATGAHFSITITFSTAL